MTTGFSLLFWVRETSTLLHGLSDVSRTTIAKELLNDAATLIGYRWNLDVIQLTINGTPYAYTNNSRFNLSASTVKTALGTLTEHIDFQKGGYNTTAEQAVHYRECKLKWQVPEQVTDPTTSGWLVQEQEQTSPLRKQKRF